MSYVTGLRCRECGASYPVAPRTACECFAPLEIVYDVEGWKKAVTRETIAAGPPTIWRYRELLPLEKEPTCSLAVGFTPLVRAPRLGKALGCRNLWIKNDAVNSPTLSFKDRVVAVAVNKALEFGFRIVACASTGNLANSVAAQAAAAGLQSYVFIPEDLEDAKILGSAIYGAKLVKIRGNYDQVNRLCSQIAGEYGWGFVNVNLRAFYAEGSKTLAYEVAEQLGWRLPQAIVIPIAGGSLITRVRKAFQELTDLGLVAPVPVKMFGAQATGCSPVTTAAKRGTTEIEPQKPSTIARSLAIGSPADGYYAARSILNSGGAGEDVSDPEIVEGMRLLAETEGVFGETAAGVTVAVTRKLLQQGQLDPGQETVLCVTGNGLKTLDAVQGQLDLGVTIRPRLEEFEAQVLKAMQSPSVAVR
ncbi:MAG: threonine synthase [Acidobacteria bacterium RIFCSPLOWO2_12_FULL_60_22]|nr:MAG: threonine synthase [Acidobacteria bacterium RIFCSPLOWO2_12_FULL_60_22]